MGLKRSGVAKLGSNKPIVASKESDIQLINATTTLSIGVGKRYFNDSRFNLDFIRTANRDIFLNSYLPGGSNNGRTLEFTGGLDTATAKLERRELPGLGSAKPFDVIELTSGTIASDVDVFLAIEDRARGVGRYSTTVGGGRGSIPVSVVALTNGERLLGGIAITTAVKGNDLILSSGPGVERSTTDRDSFTLVNRTSSYVNIQNGDDAVIGGFGSDYFGSKSYDELYDLSSEKQSSKSSARGTKLFIGGSSNDVLDGGADADYLVGDRFNGYELYWKTSNPFDSLPPSSPWASQATFLSNYQRVLPNGVGDRLTGVTVKTLSSGAVTSRTPYSLWMPGNDVIRGYEGNDFIFGDDNAINNLAQLKVLKDNITGVNPSDLDKYGPINASNFNSVRLGADFIDAGEGNDEIHAGFGSDAIIGGGGSDLIDLGAQVAVKGYTPFFGPKVAYGDHAFWNGSEWQSDPSTKAPDVFIIGALYTQESDIQASKSDAFLNYSQSSSIRESIESFENQWKTYDRLVKLIPKLDVISKVVNGGISAIKALFPAPKPFAIVGDSRPKANDTITVIKDFDPFDQLTFSLFKGEQYEARKTTNLTLSSDTSNPLLGNIQGKRGTIIEVRGDAGTVYNRVFLEGYESGLVSLKTESTADATFYTLGGRDYGDILDANGKAVFGNVF